MGKLVGLNSEPCELLSRVEGGSSGRGSHRGKKKWDSLTPGSGRSLEKEMAIHSSILAWRIQQTGEPGGLYSLGLQRVGHNWVTNPTTTRHSMISSDLHRRLSKKNQKVKVKVHGILQARILEWVAFPFSRGSSQPRDQTQVSHIAGGFFTSWATREAQDYWSG